MVTTETIGSMVNYSSDDDDCKKLRYGMDFDSQMIFGGGVVAGIVEVCAVSADNV